MNEYDKLLEEKGTLPPPSLLPAILKAPWTPEQVTNLKLRQADVSRHPYTCGTKEKHNSPLADTSLTPDVDGWHCPTCDYTQDWCHTGDAEPQIGISRFKEFLERNKVELTEEQRAEIDKLLD